MMGSPSGTCSLSGVLIGDELGQIKRMDLHCGSKMVTVNYEAADPSPSKSVTSISSFDNEVSSVLFLVSKKPNTILLYNCVTNDLNPLRSPAAENDASIIGSQPIGRSDVIACYDNGSIFMQNIEKEMLQSTETKKKALKLLGLDLEKDNKPLIDLHKSRTTSNANSESSKLSSTRPRPKPSQTANLSASKNISECSSLSSSSTCIYSPNFNTSNACLTCFKACNNRLAAAGRNMDLKVFDLNTKQCIFTAKSSKHDWLGLKHQTWVSSLDWVGGNSRTNSQPSMVATCSRSDSCVRIYDIKSKQRKPVMNINLKDETFNNNSNPPSFTSLCATSAPHSVAIPTQNIVLGTTIGRMIAVDLRFNSRSYRHLGCFKGFGGGAIRDIKYTSQGINTYRIISCSLDRFVRIHTFSTSANSTRQLDAKFYVKTRPTCVQPICSTFAIAPLVSHIDDDDDIDIE